MNGKQQLWMGIALGAVLVLLLGVVAWASGWVRPALAQTPSPTANPGATASAAADTPRTIIVVGEGTVKIQPDIARANIGVETLGSTVKQATSEAATTMEAVLAALKSQGIAEKDIQTSGYSVWADRNGGPEGRDTEKVTYRVNNNVSVVIRDLAKVGAVLDAAIEAGANSIYGLTFSVDEPQKLAAQAREKAVADALSRAQELARLNGVEVGAVVSISEVIGSSSYPANDLRAASKEAVYGLGGAGAVLPGELELTMHLQMIYAIQG